MISLELDPRHNGNYRVLCLGAHSDDIEIGCGGTVLKLIESYKRLEFYWVVFSGDHQRKQEALKSASLFLARTRKKTVVVKDYRTSFFPPCESEIKEYFESLKQEFSPDLILTHYRNDLHQDHRIISDLTWNTFRNHLILEYEIPKYDGDLGRPNFFVPLEAGLCSRKIRDILGCFKTQRSKHWFTKDTFQGILRLRGVEACASSKYAEAFHVRKMIL